MSWQTDLIKRYPGQFRSEFSDATSGYPSVGDGWQLIVERAIGRIDAALAELPGNGKALVRIAQIKEKFGGLRIYADWTVLPPDIEAKIKDAIELAEARAYSTCELCGAVGRLHDRSGWYLTRCERHAEGEPVPSRHGESDLHVRYTVVGGKMIVLRCRRYDRDLDTLVDVPLPPDWNERT